MCRSFLPSLFPLFVVSLSGHKAHTTGHEQDAQHGPRHSPPGHTTPHRTPSGTRYRWRMVGRCSGGRSGRSVGPLGVPAGTPGRVGGRLTEEPCRPTPPAGGGAWGGCPPHAKGTPPVCSVFVCIDTNCPGLSGFGLRRWRQRSIAVRL